MQLHSSTEKGGFWQVIRDTDYIALASVIEGSCRT